MKPAGSQQCFALVQRVFIDLKLHLPAVKCMLDQERVKQGFEYAAQVSLSQEDCVEILSLYPCLNVLEVCTLVTIPRDKCTHFNSIGTLLF